MNTLTTPLSLNEDPLPPPIESPKLTAMQKIEKMQKQQKLKSLETEREENKQQEPLNISLESEHPRIQAKPKKPGFFKEQNLKSPKINP